MDLDKYGSFKMFQWTHDYLVNVLTTGKNKIVTNPRLVKAVKLIKREDFVDENEEIYADKDLEIDFGQKIIRPTISAFMVEKLNPKVGARVLDIGTGSGYSAALLAVTIGDNGMVYSVDRIQYLIDIARNNIAKYHELKNIEFVFRDAALGLPERAPYDCIHIGVGFKEVPDQIKNQLIIGGKLIAPLTNYKIVLIERVKENDFKETYFDGLVIDEIVSGVV